MQSSFFFSGGKVQNAHHKSLRTPKFSKHRILISGFSISAQSTNNPKVIFHRPNFNPNPNLPPPATEEGEGEDGGVAGTWWLWQASSQADIDERCFYPMKFGAW